MVVSPVQSPTPNVEKILKVSLPENMHSGGVHQADHILAAWHAGNTRPSPEAARRAKPDERNVVGAAAAAESHTADAADALPAAQHEVIPHTEGGPAAALLACAEAQLNGEWA